MVYIHAMEYYSAIKRNKIMPFVATWMDIELIILSEVRQRKTNRCYHLYAESSNLSPTLSLLVTMFSNSVSLFLLISSFV